jgi:hypothetical protein
MAQTMKHLALRVFSLGVLLAAPPLAAQPLGTGAFPDASKIERQLRRGTSLKADVQKILGVPNGTGQSDWRRPAGMAPVSSGEGPREIWFYDDIRITDIRSGGNAPATMKVRQQILLVFFQGETFDGYLWTSNALAPVVDR